MAAVSENGTGEELSTELAARAAILCQEDPPTRDIHTEEIQRCMTTQVPGAPNDIEHILRFLRANEFRLSKTTENIKSFYKYKCNNPELFKPLSIQAASNIIYGGILGVLPGRDSQGGRVMYFRIGLWDPEKLPMLDIFSLAITLQLVLLKEPETQVGGMRTLADMEGLNWPHIKTFSVPDWRKVAKFYEDAFPMRFDGLHCINDAGLFDRLYTLTRPFLSVRFKSRTHFHEDNYESVYDFIPVESLPELYGGPVTHKDIQDYTLSLLRGFRGDDFGEAQPLTKITRQEDKKASQSVVLDSTQGSYTPIDSS